MPEPRRLSVTLDPRSAERVDRLAQDSAGKAEAIREGLALEELYRDTIREGGKVFIQRADGSIAEIVRP